MGRRPILVVDDEVNVAKFVSASLKAVGYEAAVATTGEEALTAVNHLQVDLVILDLMLPGIDGLEVCRRIRSFSEVPIIVLSAKSEEADKITALSLGADDYLTKPFGAGELLARVQAVLRRSQRQVPEGGAEAVKSGGFVLDPKSRRLTVGGREMRLTRTECNLLHFLMKRPGNLVSYQALLTSIWGQEYRGQIEYLRVYVGRLRQKIEMDPANPDHLICEPGLGYMFRGELPGDGLELPTAEVAVAMVRPSQA